MQIDLANILVHKAYFVYYVLFIISPQAHAPLPWEGLGEEAKCSAYAPVVLANACLGDKTFGNASPHLGKASRQSAGVFFRLVGRHDNWREACNGVANVKPKEKLNATALQISNQKVC